MSTAKNILDGIKHRRAGEEALEQLRKRTARNVPLAIFYFSMAAFWLWRASTHGLTGKIDGKDFLLTDGVLYAASAVIWLVVGFQRLWVSPSDKLLLLLADEALAKKDPNQPPTPAGPSA